MTIETIPDAPSLLRWPLLRWLDQAVQQECSDLHLVSGYAPVLRTNGRLVPIHGTAILTSKAIGELLSTLHTRDAQ